jgi:serine/threonine protein kinase
VFITVCAIRNIEGRQQGNEIFVQLTGSHGQKFATPRSSFPFPTWTNEFEFKVPSSNKGTVTLDLITKRRGVNDTLGEIVLALGAYKGKTENWVTLQKRKGAGDLLVRVTVNDGMSSLVQRYEIGAEVGRGATCIVKKATDKQTSKTVAIKVIDRAHFKDTEVNPEMEVDILKGLRHPNIVEYYDCYVTHDNIYLVMEYIGGGELYYKVAQGGCLSEKKAAHYTEQVLRAAEYMHQKGIVHRDLKPENLLLSSTDEDQLKLIDFGDAENYFSAYVLSGRAGSTLYVAPEVLRGDKYTSACDIWSIGVILFVLLCGYPPFYSESQDELNGLIIKGQPKYTDHWNSISDSAKDLVRKMLTVDQATRPSASVCLAHPYFQGSSHMQETVFAPGLFSMNFKMLY